MSIDFKTIKAGEKLVKVSFEDYDHISEYSWYITDNGYAKSSLPKGKGTILMHREIMKPDKGIQIDHVNNDKLDNRRDNLRFTTPSQNRQRSAMKVNGYLGVDWNKGKWQARIRDNGKQICIGRYDLPEDAAREYDKKALEIHGSHARVNFPA